jgi:uncharacterized protein YcsI (UPF0317 family)
MRTAARLGGCRAQRLLHTAPCRSLAPQAQTSPLGAFVATTESASALRTGFTHHYQLREGLDRTPAQELRQRCRGGKHTGQTSGLAPGFVQANFVAVDKQYAFDFLLFALRNPKPCPLLAVTSPGEWEPRNVAPGSDLRMDIPKYCIYREGEMVEEVADISGMWTKDMVGFLLGCSFSWEDVLKQAGHPPRHMEQGRNVPMFETNVPNVPSGPFAGNLVVSMRPYAATAVVEVAALTGCYYPWAAKSYSCPPVCSAWRNY